MEFYVKGFEPLPGGSFLAAREGRKRGLRRLNVLPGDISLRRRDEFL